ncbi:MAG: TlpA family protein disulfide reductase [Paludibacteraceae bacterium]|nr:TlpA family protein disulfide reductase [Paludibacteraceae bacterium]
MKKIGLIFSVWLLTSFAMQAQAYTNLVGQKTPELIIEKWISPAPELQGKFIIIDFWATWCPPCRVSIPHMNALAAKYADHAVVIGLSKEAEATVRAFKGMEYYSAIDTKGRLQIAVGVRGIPNVIIIDPEGMVRWQGHPANLSEEIMDALIADYTQKLTTAPVTPVERLVNVDEPYDNHVEKPTNNSTDEAPGQNVDIYDHL